MPAAANSGTSKPLRPPSIKEWPLSERPRERLLAQGAAALSDAELLAVILRSGIKGRDAIAYARDLIQHYGSLRAFLNAPARDWMKACGLGPARSAVLMAARELTRRELREEMIGRDAIRDPESVMRYLTFTLRDRKKEVFKVIFLDKANRVIDERDLFFGTVDEAAVHPREVVEAAIERRAAALLLVHNHPSGRAMPSAEDREITRRLTGACLSVSVRILDHLVIGNNEHFSFREHGLI